MLYIYLMMSVWWKDVSRFVASCCKQSQLANIKFDLTGMVTLYRPETALPQQF